MTQAFLSRKRAIQWAFGVSAVGALAVFSEYVSDIDRQLKSAPIEDVFNIASKVCVDKIAPGRSFGLDKGGKHYTVTFIRATQRDPKAPIDWQVRFDAPIRAFFDPEKTNTFSIVIKSWLADPQRQAPQRCEDPIPNYRIG